MKSRTRFTLAFLGICSFFAFTNISSADVIHVFLIGGQSNGDGRGDAKDLPAELQEPQADVIFYYGWPPGLTTLRPRPAPSAQFGPEITFGRTMADYYKAKGSSIALLKSSPGGTNLAVQWAAGDDATKKEAGPIYQNFQKTVREGLATLKKAHPESTFQIDGMIWMQGEGDTHPEFCDQYEANLTAFINDIRKLYGANLPFVIGELSSAQTGTGPAEIRNIVREAQVKVSQNLPRVGLVNTDNLTLRPDKVHFNADGQQALGKGFASAMQKLVESTQ